MSAPTRRQQLGLWLIAAIIGLGLGQILDASAVVSIVLVAVAGIATGIVFAAIQRARDRSDRPSG
jgi:hypothetical protein